MKKKVDVLGVQVESALDTMREAFNSKPDCNHPANEISNFFNKIVTRKSIRPDQIKSYLCDQRSKIKENLNKISIAPGEKGKWKNWGDDIYLEEKMFPSLFPYGVGGYLSSNMIRKSNMGFSNYVKSRLLSVNSKFRNDPTYIFFLQLVKEMIDMRRSETTVLRKATKIPALNARNVTETNLEFLKRNNTAFSTFKTIRGTAMYYQDIKKKLNAFIRDVIK